MEDGAPRIRRRVSVRKRNRGSLESLSAAAASAELQPAEDPEEEAATGNRRRKTGSPEPAQVQPCRFPAEPGPVITEGCGVAPRPLPRPQLRGVETAFFPGAHADRLEEWPSLAFLIFAILILSSTWETPL